MKKALLGLCCALAVTQLTAQTSLIAPVAAGTAAVLAKGSKAEKAGIVFGAGLAGGLIGEYMESKAQQKQMETYMLGRYHEAYIRAFAPWFKATLDPTTGRPAAFDGYWAMDIGLPDQSQILPSPEVRVVSTGKKDYEATLPKMQEKKEEEIARAAATTEIITRKKVVDGVEYTAQKVIYPRLPKRQ